MKSVAVVGASLSGLRAAESLIRAGFDGKVTIFGEEVHQPYNRPPLSKEALTGSGGLDSVALRSSLKDRITFSLGARVVESSLADETLTLADGSRHMFNGLIAATGLRPRTLAIPKPRSGIFVLRSFDHMVELQHAIRDKRKVAIVGAGFVGCELAASLTKLGHEVVIIAPEPAPMLRPLGLVLGSSIAKHHQANGVQFGLNRLPLEIVGDSHPKEIVCDDGSRFETDIVIEAIGSITNTEWLENNGLDLTDGILCNDYLQFRNDRAFFAVGDIARFPNYLFDSVPRRVEHWGIAVDSGRYAGKALAAVLSGATSPTNFVPLPAFWSDQFSLRIQSFGMPGLVTDADSIHILEGNLEGDVALGYYRDSILVGVVLVGMATQHLKYRTMVEESLAKY